MPLVDKTAVAGSLWLSWPKKSSGVVTDLDENVIRQAALDAGVVDVKVAAVDDVWSALKFVRRLKDRWPVLNLFGQEGRPDRDLARS